jgi:predicted amidophosphoribosyltransferase
MLARRAAEELKIPFRPRLLEKVRGGERMAGLGLRQRRVAVRGLYRARGKVSGPVLLVDDVVTTTHTLRASARALRGAGAEEVHVAALARTPIGPLRD